MNWDLGKLYSGFDDPNFAKDEARLSVCLDEVDQILVVEPHEVEPLQVEEGKDLCTLVTCTPYGINSHRLLVRGHRIENEVASALVRVTSDAVQIEPVLVAPVLAMPILFVLLVMLLLPKKRVRK